MQKRKKTKREQKAARRQRRTESTASGLTPKAVVNAVVEVIRSAPPAAQVMYQMDCTKGSNAVAQVLEDYGVPAQVICAAVTTDGESIWGMNPVWESEFKFVGHAIVYCPTADYRGLEGVTMKGAFVDPTVGQFTDISSVLMFPGVGPTLPDEQEVYPLCDAEGRMTIGYVVQPEPARSAWQMGRGEQDVAQVENILEGSLSFKGLREAVAERIGQSA